MKRIRMKIKETMKRTLIEFLKALPGGLFLLIVLVAPFALMRGLYWCTEPYYASEDVAWTICDKYHSNRFRIPDYYAIVLEYSNGDITMQEEVSVEKEAWSDYVIGDTVMYPAEIVSNWEHYVKGIDPETAE